MNCQSTDLHLPMFVGGDLDESAASAVMEHVEACGDCMLQLDEYRRAMLIVRGSATPVFSETVYADIRRGVLSEIDTCARVSIFSNLFRSFRTPYRWAMAAALLLAIALVGITQFDRTDLKGNKALPLAQPIAEPYLEESLAAPMVGIAKFIAGPNDARPRRIAAAAKALLKNRPRRNAADGDDRKATADPPPNSVATLEKNVPEFPPLRIEMQTKDPNIRIIWFTKQSN